jgi:hypothetical protein
MANVNQALSYSQYLLSGDMAITGRVSAIMKDESMVEVGENAVTKASRYMSDIAAEPGLAEAYHTALLNGVEDPGAANDVITDGQLLSAVVAVMSNAGVSP